MKECIVVLGMHRSGTSVLTGLVSLFGGYVGSDLMKPTEDNPKGYFENNKIYLLNEKILRECNSSWDDFLFVVDDIAGDQFQKYVTLAKEIIKSDLKYVKRTIIKDPRICILFPIWEQALKELDINIKLIFAYRSPMEVAHSLQKRDEMTVEKGLMLWSHHFLLSELYSRNHDRIVVEYDHDFQDLPSLINRIAAFVGSPVSDEILEQANEFYTPSLKHHRVTLDNISNDLPRYLNDVIKILADKKFDDQNRLDEIRGEFEYSKQYYLYNHKQLIDGNKILEEEARLLQKQHHTLEIEYTKLKDKRIKEKKILERKNLDLKKIIEEQDVVINTKNKGLQLLESYLINGNEIFRELFDSRPYYNRMKRDLKGLLSLKVKKVMLPLAGRKSKRLIRDQKVIIQSGLFSAFYYLALNSDVKKSGVDPLTHFCKFGWKENRNPNLSFDLAAYMRLNPDVVKIKMNPLVHYILHGQSEGRQVTPVQLLGKNYGNTRKQKYYSVESGSQMIGPVIEGRWEESISIISVLSQQGKLSNKKIPQEVISLSRKQLEILPLKVSVVMPTWNRENSICSAIDSVLAQSYKPFELIISDDGSTDGTVDVLKQQYHSEISAGLLKIINNDHKGVSAARNSGLKEATGDLIAYLDSDNHWREHYLLIMSSAFSENDELNCAYSALESNDKNNNNKKIRATSYNRKQLIDSNFIDLNVFMHRKIVYEQFGGFDTQLKRLVDWELIIRYTKNYEPAFLSFIGVDYFLDDANLKNITTTVSLDDNRQHIYQKHFQERVRYGLEGLRIAYVLWDFPALSQTFVMEELKWLVGQGHDVIVYYSVAPDKSAILDFDIDAHLVKDSDELAELLVEHQRNLCHTHFAYPTTTLLTYPACVKTNTYFTFMPHAVDIFHHENKKRNKIGEISQHPLCLKVLVHGEFHKNFIEECGVPSEKIAFNIQAVNIADFEKYKKPQSQKIKEENEVCRGIVISRFVEKKGLSTLFEAAVLLKNERVVFDIYGYGPLEENYKKQIAELGLNNVLLKGALTSQKDAAKAYEESDFLIAPCVVAENGDMDGFPTVILEAMAVGLPVITTDVAAIPDYLTDGVEALVAKAGDTEQIADYVRRLLVMSPERKAAMIKRSHEFLDKKIGVERTMQMLLDIWQAYSVEIFLVTFNTQEYDDKEETFEIINRIIKYTTTPFTLTVVDNNSDEDFWAELCERVKGYPNVRLIRKYENQYCGPGSNIALELSNSEYAIYICSKEGFIKKHGWERALLDHMRNNPDNAIAGYHSQMPNYVYGKEYENHPDFSKFRNQEFAQENPNRVFKHVQGGVFIIDRKFIKEHGGFNPETPHGGMDIEMSYYIESLGYGLGEIQEVASLTVKTLPKLPAILNERTVVAHPLMMDSVGHDLDSLTRSKGQRCNVCGWQGELFIMNNTGQSAKCPDCHSTGFGRSILKLLSNSHHIYRGETCAVLSKDKSMKQSLAKLFKPLLVTDNEELFLSALKSSESQIGCIIVDSELINDSDGIWPLMVEKLSNTGEIIFADTLFEDDRILNNANLSTNKQIQSVLSSVKSLYSIEYCDFTSYCLAYDWRRFGRLTRVNK